MTVFLFCLLCTCAQLSCVPVFFCLGLDADLLAVIPAFSRHPSLKHLMLGKNFNIKGRYGPLRGSSRADGCEVDADDECFSYCLCLCRVLDEILQKLVHLVQEEECVSLIM